jgi:hypothetical protein
MRRYKDISMLLNRGGLAINRNLLNEGYKCGVHWRFNKGTNGIYQVVTFRKVKPPKLALKIQVYRCVSEGKTGFTSWHYNFGSTACQEMKIYLELNIDAQAVDEGSDGIFYFKRGTLDGKAGLRLSLNRMNIKTWIKNPIIQAMNTDEH